MHHGLVRIISDRPRVKGSGLLGGVWMASAVPVVCFEWWQVGALTTVAPHAIFYSGSGGRAWVSQRCSEGSYVLSRRLGSALLFYELGFHTLAQAGLALPIKSRLLASNSTFLSPRC